MDRTALRAQAARLGIVLPEPQPARRVRATKSDAPCGWACQTAIGDECVCSCVGDNHGIRGGR